jgi:hypothetical protein
MNTPSWEQIWQGAPVSQWPISKWKLQKYLAANFFIHKSGDPKKSKTLIAHTCLAEDMHGLHQPPTPTTGRAAGATSQVPGLDIASGCTSDRGARFSGFALRSSPQDQCQRIAGSHHGAHSVNEMKHSHHVETRIVQGVIACGD